MTWLVGFGVLTAVAMLFTPEFVAWWKEWQNPTGMLTHGPVVPVLAGVLIWIEWDRLKEIPRRPSLWGLLLILPALALLTFGRVSHITFLGGFAWLLFLPGAIWLLQGRALAWALLPAVALMVFQLPLPKELIEPISLPIQEHSTLWATRYLAWALIPVERDQSLIHLPHYTLDVGIQCSGFKLLLGLMMFGSFLAAAHQGAWWKKLLLIGLCLPLTTLVNAARIALNGVIGEFAGFQIGHLFHENAGIFVWAMSLAGLYLLMAALRCNRLKGTDSS
jgi:exosortase